MTNESVSAIRFLTHLANRHKYKEEWMMTYKKWIRVTQVDWKYLDDFKN
jgi:hypothetical protein